MRRLVPALATSVLLLSAAPAAASTGAWHSIRFDHVVRSADRAALERAGAKGLQPTGRRSYAAYMDARSVRAASLLAHVRRLGVREKIGVSLGSRLALVVEWRGGARAVRIVSSPDIVGLARDPDVLHVGRAPLGLLPEEEGGGQILAGNVKGETPQPGYLDWLKGVAADGTGVLVSVVDTGIDEQHPDLAGQVVAKVDYTRAGENGVDDGGHGTHVAGIVAGTDATAAQFSDPDGLAYGLGVAPGAKLLDQNAVSFLGGGLQTPVSPIVLREAIPMIARDAVRAGATLWNASWQTGEGPGVGYVESARMLDVATRDADPETAGNQPLIMVFSAGNSGRTREERTLTAPHEAKNIIAVAASVMPRGGNSSEIANFSSRGPGRDGRILPTVTAPGAAVVSTRALVGPLCGTDPPMDSALPSPLHSVCSGTSMAAPHAAGAVALLVQWWRAFNGGASPSPAMAKALLVNTAQDLGDPDVPNIHEGWGRVDTGALLAPGAQRIYVDQSHVFTEPGEIRSMRVEPVDPSQPVRATLVWSDAPGAARPLDNEETEPPALVNDLDLAVSGPAGGFQANRFDGGYSVPGGEEDRLNNVENVWLRAPVAGPLTVSVKASALPGDGVPQSGDTTDQDYALVISNARILPEPGPGTAARKPRIRAAFKRGRVRRLTITDVPAGARVTVTCRGSCPRRGLRLSYPTATRRVELASRLRKWRPKVLRVAVKAPQPGLSVSKRLKAR